MPRAKRPSVNRSRNSSARLCILGVDAMTSALHGSKRIIGMYGKSRCRLLLHGLQTGQKLGKAARSCCKASSSWLSLTANSARRSSKLRVRHRYFVNRAPKQWCVFAAFCCACKICASARSSACRFCDFRLAIECIQLRAAFCAQAGAAKIKTNNQGASHLNPDDGGRAKWRRAIIVRQHVRVNICSQVIFPKERVIWPRVLRAGSKPSAGPITNSASPRPSSRQTASCRRIDGWSNRRLHPHNQPLMIVQSGQQFGGSRGSS